MLEHVGPETEFPGPILYETPVDPIWNEAVFIPRYRFDIFFLAWPVNFTCHTKNQKKSLPQPNRDIHIWIASFHPPGAGKDAWIVHRVWIHFSFLVIFVHLLAGACKCDVQSKADPACVLSLPQHGHSRNHTDSHINAYPKYIECNFTPLRH